MRYVFFILIIFFQSLNPVLAQHDSLVSKSGNVFPPALIERNQCSFTPSFTHSPFIAHAFQDVLFTDNTPGAVSWKWYIGNRLVSTNRTFTYQFRQGGSHFVMLHVSDGNCEAVEGDKINVKEVCNRNNSRFKISASESISLADMVETINNQVIISGQLSGPASSGGGLVACIDLNGVIKWSRKYAAADTVKLKKIIVFPDGNIGVAGNIHGQGDQSDGLVIKLDSLGRELWVKRLALPGKTVHVEGLSTFTGESMIITGSVTSGQNKSALAAKLNGAGNIVWQKEYSKQGNAEAVQSVFKDRELFVVGNMPDLLNKRDVFMMQVDTGDGSLFRVIKLDAGSRDNIALDVSNRNNWEFFTENPYQSSWPLYISMKIYDNDASGRYKAAIVRHSTCCGQYLGQQFDPGFMPDQFILQPSHREAVVGLFRKNAGEYLLFEQNSGGGNEWAFSFRPTGAADIRAVMPFDDGTYMAGLDITENGTTSVELIKTGLKGSQSGVGNNCKGIPDTVNAAGVSITFTGADWDQVNNLSLISTVVSGFDYQVTSSNICSGTTCIPVPAVLPPCNDFFAKGYLRRDIRFTDMQVLDNEDIAIGGWENTGGMNHILKGVQALFNKKGEVRWAKMINSSAGSMRVFDVAKAENNHLLISGFFQASFGGPGFPSVPALCKMDLNGQVAWMKTFKSDQIGVGFNNISDVIRLQDNSYVFLINCRYAGSPYFDGLVVVHTDSDGNVRWSKKVVVNGDVTYGNSVIEEGGNVVIAAVSSIQPNNYTYLTLLKIRQGDGQRVFSKTVKIEQFHRMELWDPVMEKRPNGGYNILFNDHRKASIEQLGSLVLAQLDTAANVTSLVFSELPGYVANTWIHEGVNGIYGANYGHTVGADMLFRLNDKGYNGFTRKMPLPTGEYIIREKNNKLIVAGTSLNGVTYTPFLYKLNADGYLEGCLNVDQNSQFHFVNNPGTLLVDASTVVTDISLLAESVVPDTLDITSSFAHLDYALCQTVPPCTFSLSADKQYQCGRKALVTVKVERSAGCQSSFFWDWDKTALQEVGSTDSTIVLDWLREDTITVYLKTSENCTDAIKDSIRIAWTRGDTISLGRDSVFCAGNQFVPLTLQAGTGFSGYQWQDGSSGSDFQVTEPGTYFVSAINSCALRVSDTIKFALGTPVIAHAEKSNDIDCAFASSQLLASGGIYYLWTPSSGLNDNTVFNPVASPLQTTIYTVNVRDINGCKSTDTVSVRVSATGGMSFLLPSAFTPNNDGLNDCFGIKNTGIIYDLSFSLYNRWGERIFYTENPADCWDGLYKGKKQDTGVYVYMVRARTSCGEVFKKGTFTLIR